MIAPRALVEAQLAASLFEVEGGKWCLQMPHVGLLGEGRNSSVTLVLRNSEKLQSCPWYDDRGSGLKTRTTGLF